MTVITSARVMVACGLKYSLPLLLEPFIMFARETAATAPRAQLGILSSSAKPSVDLDSIRNTAMTEYGMSYAKESQIVYYTVNDDDYMNQYSEIPRE